MNKNILSHRRTLLPYLAKKLKAKTYLEIGVKGGKTFMPIKVRKKIAVDPSFRIKSKYKKQQIFKYFFNYFNKYIEETSDVFFEKYAGKLLKENSLDLAFIDGLHTYEQTYKDIGNTLPYLKDSGIILVHDCSPKSEAAAFPAQSIEDVKKINPPGFDGLWSGDVWKIIPRLKLSHPKLNVFVVDCDSGLGIISKKKFLCSKYIQTSNITYSIQDIHNWEYKDLVKIKDDILSIVSFEEMLRSCL